MKAIFAPLIGVLMHQRNTVKMSLIGVFYTVPLAIALWFSHPAWTSAAGIAIILTFLFACYYLVAMFLTSDESWATVNLVARRLAENDLRRATGDVDLDAQARRLGGGQFGKLFGALRDAHGSLRELASQAVRSAGIARRTAGELVQGNAELSRRSDDQAATLEETSAAMEELSVTVRENAESCRKASDLAAEATVLARQGATASNQTVTAMEKVDASARRIADIIGVIEGISFQTNILALNAAVEAARAGEQGRGFAVVASEVRSLAQRSADAAREIRALIEDAVSSVDAQVRLVQDTGRIINEVVHSIEGVNELVGVVAVASREQASGVGNVGQALVRLQGATQETAARVQRTAVAAATLEREADALFDLVGRFRLDESREGKLLPSIPRGSQPTVRR